MQGASVETAAEPKCSSGCLTCDAKDGSCTSCPAKFGLNSATPKRCVPCSSAACIDCDADYRRCVRCAFGLYRYLAPNGTCQFCTAFGGPCDRELGCNSDGSCKACAWDAFGVR
ncbi:hypothetical protein CHLNCDRAFT_143708 [Chlorella variabilis]|uniref:Uncharacterized protein n=1 Tax=Chlorella variabilis TaxID=554065 RepID=E1ZAA3_CHLVA|nr:hypothetical protein CHLNCDRAFT_143708 [Chlorella variabilis]EFN57227.1 hypothetical protein CHLNCDRAFT_143708 [Chlorella variabilis]|eukprot:XP_005849329.1 hypothetical protein CHLNCDRAFT_143708 [Chlorella variabilis]